MAVQQFEQPIFFTRNFSCGNSVCGSVDGKHGLVFDDEGTSLGTFIEAGEYLQSLPTQKILSISAVLSHLILSSPDNLAKIQEWPLVRRVLGTDTIPAPAEKRIPKLEIVSVAQNFADAIKLIYERKSVDDYKEKLYNGLRELAEQKLK